VPNSLAGDTESRFFLTGRDAEFYGFGTTVPKGADSTIQYQLWKNKPTNVAEV
jgi:hypothetical protein